MTALPAAVRSLPLTDPGEKLPCLAADPRAYLAAIVAFAQEAIVAETLRGTITAWNVGAERTYGWSAAEALGRPSTLIVPPDRRHELRRIIDALRRGQPVAPLESVRLHRDGRRIDVLLSVSPIHDPVTGLLSGLSVMGRDITERVEAEHRLRALNDKLERQVERRNRFMRLLREMAILANESGSVEEAMRRALDLLCASLGWPAGHVFLSDPAHPECLVDAGIWRLDSPPDFRSFVEVTRRTAFRCGEGFLGTAAACAVPRWISDVSADPRIACAVPRPPIRTLLLFPLLVGRRVAGVLELFSREAAAPDEGLLRGLLPCGAQLGRIVERREIERQVADASLEEQRRIGHELHDTLGQ